MKAAMAVYQGLAVVAFRCLSLLQIDQYIRRWHQLASHTVPMVK